MRPWKFTLIRLATPLATAALLLGGCQSSGDRDGTPTLPAQTSTQATAPATNPPPTTSSVREIPWHLNIVPAGLDADQVRDEVGGKLNADSGWKRANLTFLSSAPGSPLQIELYATAAETRRACADQRGDDDPNIGCSYISPKGGSCLIKAQHSRGRPVGAGVFAHELGHCMGLRHGSSNLMQPRFDRNEELAAAPSDAEINRIRNQELVFVRA